ncbi:response regulator [Paenibacillus cymbidii]|uniref:response regulator n=1 Tax=Paenibacillus cymbidii TaxID=1639034 RepID=UPI001081A498|nr:response regulator [Paenibacillus cymbidii]
MYKMIIVDDEATTRYGLRVCVDWNAYGIEIVGEAGGGEAGLQLAEQLRPDIVLTDVKMPGMDGIEMVGQLRRRFEKMKVIFISGYDDIEYLKQAMKFDAIDYIFKPVNLAELLQVVQKVVDLSKEEKGQQDILLQMSAKLRESMPLLRERFFIQLLTDDKGQDAHVLEKRIEFLDLSLPLASLYCTLIVSLDNKASILGQMSQKETELISFSVQNICQEVVRGQLFGYVIEHTTGEYVIILQLTNDEEQEEIFSLVAELKVKLHDFLERFIHTSLTVGVGSCVHHLKDLSYSYRTASEAVQMKLFLGNNKIITVDDMETGRNVDLRNIHTAVNALPSLLKKGMEDKLLACLDALFDEIAHYRGMTQHHCRTIALQVLSGASHFLVEYDMATETLQQQERKLGEVLFQLETIYDMKLALSEYLVAVCRIVGEKRSKKTHEVIDRIKAVIREQYPMNLTIDDISNQVFFSSTYICLLFKQETGETINDYLTRTRMEQAKELLVNTDLKLHDICFKIGYAEPGYFSKQFKKMFGFSPSEYRDIYSNS